MKFGEVKLTVLLDILRAGKNAKQFTADMRGMEAQANRTGVSTVKLQSSIQNLGLRFQGLQSIVTIFKSTFGDLITSYQQQEIAIAKLNNGLKNVGEGSAAFEKLSKQASNLQKVTVFGDEQITNAQAMLTTFMKSSEEIEILTPRLLDLAAAFDQSGEGGKSLQEVAVMLGKVNEETLGALRRVGVAFSQEQEAKLKSLRGTEQAIYLGKILDQNFKGLAETVGNTTAGSMAKLKNVVGDLKEEWGKLLAEAILPLIMPLKDLALLITNAEPNVKKATLALGALGVAFAFAGGHISLIAKAFLVFNALLIAMPTPMKAIVAVLALVTAGFVGLNTSIVVLNTQLGGIPLLIGLVVTAIAALVGVFSDLSVSNEELGESVTKSSQSIADQRSNIEALNTVAKKHSETLTMTESEQKNYNDSLNKVKTLYPQVISGIDKKTNRELVNLKVVNDLIDAEKEKLQVLKDAQSQTVAKQIADLTAEYAEQTKEVDTLNEKLKDGAKILKDEFKWNINPFQNFNDALADTSRELLDAAENAKQTRAKIVRLFESSIQNNTLIPALRDLQNALGDSEQAAGFLKDAVGDMANNMISRFVSIGTAGKSLAEIMKLIALAQNLINLSLQEGTPQAIAEALQAKGAAIFASMDAQLNALRQVQSEVGKTTSSKGGKTTKTDAKEEKEKLDLLQEYQKKIEGLKDQIKFIRSKLTEVLTPDERLFLLEEMEKANEELDQFNIKLKSVNVPREPIKEDETKIFDPLKREPLKVRDGLTEGITLASQLSSILGLGADNFISKMINGLNDAVSIVSSIARILALFGSGGVSGFFSFLGFSSGGSVPGAGTGDSVPAMLTPGEFVINKKRASQLGSGFLQWLNGGGAVSHVTPAMFGGGSLTINANGRLTEALSFEVVNKGMKLRDVKIERSSY